jgi:hypothetical protein
VLTGLQHTMEHGREGAIGAQPGQQIASLQRNGRAAATGGRCISRLAGDRSGVVLQAKSRSAIGLTTALAWMGWAAQSTNPLLLLLCSRASCEDAQARKEKRTGSHPVPHGGPCCMSM